MSIKYVSKSISMNLCRSSIIIFTMILRINTINNERRVIKKKYFGNTYLCENCKLDTKQHSTHHLLPDIWAFLKKVVCNTIGCVYNSTNWKREIINSCCALHLLVVHFIIWVFLCCFVYVIMTTYIFWRFWLVCLVWMFVLNLMSLFMEFPLASN